MLRLRRVLHLIKGVESVPFHHHITSTTPSSTYLFSLVSLIFSSFSRILYLCILLFGLVLYVVQLRFSTFRLIAFYDSPFVQASRTCAGSRSQYFTPINARIFKLDAGGPTFRSHSSVTSARIRFNSLLCSNLSSSDPYRLIDIFSPSPLAQDKHDCCHEANTCAFHCAFSSFQAKLAQLFPRQHIILCSFAFDTSQERQARCQGCHQRCFRPVWQEGISC